MKINFKYNSNKRVIKIEDFLEQFKTLYGKKYYLKKIDMGEYEATMFVSNNHVVNLEYTGNDLMYYKISFNNQLPTTLAKSQIKNNPDFVEAKLIENESLVVLQMEHYNYIPLITEYFTYSEQKSIIFDTEKDVDIICQRLSKIWMKPVSGILDYSKFDYSQDVYNGEIIINIDNKKYKTFEKNIYKTDGYTFVYIPSQAISLILTTKMPSA